MSVYNVSRSILVAQLVIIHLLPATLPKPSAVLAGLGYGQKLPIQQREIDSYSSPSPSSSETSNSSGTGASCAPSSSSSIAVRTPAAAAAPAAPAGAALASAISVSPDAPALPVVCPGVGAGGAVLFRAFISRSCFDSPGCVSSRRMTPPVG